MQTYTIHHDRFRKQKFTLGVTPLFSWKSQKPVLFVNGEPAQKKEGKKHLFSVRDDEGNAEEIEIKMHLLTSPTPIVLVGSQEILLRPKYKWYEQVLLFLPFVLMIATAGGAIPGGLSALGMLANLAIFQHPHFSRTQRYLLSGLVFLLTALAYYVVLSLVIEFL